MFVSVEGKWVSEEYIAICQSAMSTFRGLVGCCNHNKLVRLWTDRSEGNRQQTGAVERGATTRARASPLPTADDKIVR